MFVKRRKGNREIIPTTKDHKETIITETAEKAKVLNSYFAPVCFCDRYIPEIKLENSG